MSGGCSSRGAADNFDARFLDIRPVGEIFAFDRPGMLDPHLPGRRRGRGRLRRNECRWQRRRHDRWCRRSNPRRLTRCRYRWRTGLGNDGRAAAAAAADAGVTAGVADCSNASRRLAGAVPDAGPAGGRLAGGITGNTKPEEPPFGDGDGGFIAPVASGRLSSGLLVFSAVFLAGTFAVASNFRSVCDGFRNRHRWDAGVS